MTAYKLLVVDDDKEICEALATYGENRGYEVLRSNRGSLGLQLALNEKPDAILLDIMLPDLDGRDIMQRLRDAGVADRMVIVFVTARESQLDRVLGLELGADDYVAKPFHLSHLFDKLGYMLSKKKADKG